MRDEEVEAMLAMAERSAREVAPDALEDLPDYAEVLRSRKELPPSHQLDEDDTAARAIDGLLAGIGINLLLQIAKELLEALREKAVEEGATSIWNYLKSKMAPGEPATEAATEAASRAAQAVASEVANTIEVKIELPPGVDRSQVQVAITLQVQALLERELMTRALPS